MNAKAFVDNIQETLEAHQNPAKAVPMAAYMKNKFPFLGLAQTDLNPLVKPLLKGAKPLVTTKFLHDSVRLLWKQPEREYQYVALDLLYTYQMQTSTKTLNVIVHCLTTKSWWDTVDSLASLVGRLCWHYPQWLETLESYSRHENFWLRRIALLYQLNYKDKTNQKLLFTYCLANAKEEEFFIRKAIGWALREYSKSNPKAVRDFLAKHKGQFSPLSQREATKYL